MRRRKWNGTLLRFLGFGVCWALTGGGWEVKAGQGLAAPVPGWAGNEARIFDSGGLDEPVAIQVIPGRNETVLAVIGTAGNGNRSLALTKIRADGTTVFPTAQSSARGRLDAGGAQILRVVGLGIGDNGTLCVGGLLESLLIREGEPTPFLATFDAEGRQLRFVTYVPQDPPASAGPDLHHYGATAEALMVSGSTLYLGGVVSVRSGDTFGFGNHVYVSRFSSADLRPVAQGFYRPTELDVYSTNAVPSYAHEVRRMVLTADGEPLLWVKAGLNGTPDVDYLLHVRAPGYNLRGSADAFRVGFEPVDLVERDVRILEVDPEFQRPVIPSAEIEVFGADGQYARRRLYGSGSRRSQESPKASPGFLESMFGATNAISIRIPGVSRPRVLGAVRVRDGVTVFFLDESIGDGRFRLGAGFLRRGMVESADWLPQGLLASTANWVPTGAAVLAPSAGFGTAMALAFMPPDPVALTVAWLVAGWDDRGRRFVWAHADTAGPRDPASVPVGVAWGTDGVVRLAGGIGLGFGQNARILALKGPVTTDDSAIVQENMRFRWEGPGMLLNDGALGEAVRTGGVELNVDGSSISGEACSTAEFDRRADAEFKRVCAENADILEGLRLIRAAGPDGVWWIGVPGTSVPNSRAGSVVFEPRTGLTGRKTLEYSLNLAGGGSAPTVHRLHIDYLPAMRLRWVGVDGGRCLEVPGTEDPVYVDRSRDLVSWTIVTNLPPAPGVRLVCPGPDLGGDRFYRLVTP